MTPVLLHLGFHKTGTSTAQAFLQIHRKTLASHMTVGLLDQLKGAEKAARRFSKRHEVASVIETAAAFDRSLSSHRPDRLRSVARGWRATFRGAAESWITTRWPT